MRATPQKQAPAQAHDSHGNRRDHIQRTSLSWWCIQALTTARPMPRAKRSRKAGSQMVARLK